MTIFKLQVNGVRTEIVLGVLLFGLAHRVVMVTQKTILKENLAAVIGLSEIFIMDGR